MLDESEAPIAHCQSGRRVDIRLEDVVSNNRDTHQLCRRQARVRIENMRPLLIGARRRDGEIRGADDPRDQIPLYRVADSDSPGLAAAVASAGANVAGRVNEIALRPGALEYRTRAIDGPTLDQARGIEAPIQPD